MKKNQKQWAYPMTGALLCAAAASAQQDQLVCLDSTNRLTLSLRFGLNISGKFKGVGGSLNPAGAPGNGRRTPHGDAYNYDDGYVYTDTSGSHDGLTWYWGYDNSATQVSGNNILLDRTTDSALPGEQSADAAQNPGFELAYDRQFGVKEKWHHLRYGLEGAVNFQPLSFNVGGLFTGTLARVTDAYPFTPGTTPPTATPSDPYQGSYQGPGFVIGTTPTISTVLTPGVTLLAQDHLDADLWGFRAGPYLELPLGEKEKLTLRLSAGLAVGLLDANASWQETLTLPNNGGTTVTSGSGKDFDVLWGGYFDLDAAYQISRRWGVAAGVQLQDLGTYDHNFGGRVAELDMSQSVFVKVGVSYSF